MASHRVNMIPLSSCTEGMTPMLIFLTMIAMGLLLGFVGAGGSGFIIAILTVVFHIPIHTALGTSLAAMVFTSLSATYSHLREKNVIAKTGWTVGVFGALGAWIGAYIARTIPSENLSWMTGAILLASALLLWLRIYGAPHWFQAHKSANQNFKSRLFWGQAVGLGLITGMMSGVFGIGSSAFIQAGLLILFGLSVQRAAGTTMFVILPIALIGGLGYLSYGYLDVLLLIKVAAGTIIGSYIGAKFTNRLPSPVLKTAMIAVPVIGALTLFFGT